MKVKPGPQARVRTDELPKLEASIPDYFTPEQSEVWGEVYYLLDEGNLLKNVDRLLLEDLVLNLDLKRRASVALTKEELVVDGQRTIVKNPLLNIIKDCQATIHKICIQLGLSPRSRSVIAHVTEEHEDDSLDNTKTTATPWRRKEK